MTNPAKHRITRTKTKVKIGGALSNGIIITPSIYHLDLLFDSHLCIHAFLLNAHKTKPFTRLNVSSGMQLCIMQYCALHSQQIMKTMTVLEYANEIGVATSTVYRQVKRGALQTVIEDSVQKIVLPDDFGDDGKAVHMQYIDELKRQVENLEEQNAALQNALQNAHLELSKSRQRTDELIQQMQADAEVAKERSDTIVLQLTQQVDKITQQNQALTQETRLLLEDSRPKRRFWKRLFAWNGG